ncbi:MAG: hypothetical protein ABFS14_05350, partial [Gemmatimonadota bacterium]
MRKVLLTFAFLLFLAGTAKEAQAQARFGVQANIAEDFDFGVGARVALSPPGPSPIKLIGSFDLYFPDDPVDYWELNGNIVYVVPVQNSAVAPYVGGGLNIAHASVDGVPFASDTEAGLNLLGGIEFGGTVPIFVEAKVEVEGGEQFVVTGGI